MLNPRCLIFSIILYLKINTVCPFADMFAVHFVGWLCESNFSRMVDYNYHPTQVIFYVWYRASSRDCHRLANSATLAVLRKKYDKNVKKSLLNWSSSENNLTNYDIIIWYFDIIIWDSINYNLTINIFFHKNGRVWTCEFKEVPQFNKIHPFAEVLNTPTKKLE